MSTEAIHGRLQELVTPILASMGLELVELEYRPESGGWVVRLFIDRPGGVTLDICAAASREIGTLLEVEDVIPHAYTLEVSSPGIDRPLTRPGDYQRFAGERIKLRTNDAIDPDNVGTLRKTFVGELIGSADGMVTIRLENKAGSEVSLPLASIERARLDPKF